MATIYLARTRNMYKGQKGLLWVKEYHNSYTGRSFEAATLKHATMYADPGLDGMLERVKKFGAYDIEVVEFKSQ